MPLLMVGLLASQGPARAQSWAQQDDVLPLPSFQSLARFLRARGYHPFRKVCPDRSDFFLDEVGGGTGVDLSTCTFLFVRPGQTVVEVDTTGEYPNDLIIFSIERLNRDQAAAVYCRG